MDEKAIEKNRTALFWLAPILIVVLIFPVFFFEHFETNQVQLFMVALTSLAAAHGNLMLHSLWKRIEETAGKSAIVSLHWRSLLWPAMFSVAVTVLLSFNERLVTPTTMAMTLVMIVSGSQATLISLRREAVKGTDEIIEIPRFSRSIHYGVILTAIGLMAFSYFMPEQFLAAAIVIGGSVMVVSTVTMILQIRASKRLTKALGRKKMSSDPAERTEWLKYDTARRWYRKLLFLVMPLWLGGFIFGGLFLRVLNLVTPAFFGIMMVVACHSMLFQLELMPGKNVDRVASRNGLRLGLSLALIVGVVTLGYLYPEYDSYAEGALIMMTVGYSGAFVFFAWKTLKANPKASALIGEEDPIGELLRSHESTRRDEVVDVKWLTVLGAAAIPQLGTDKVHRTQSFPS